MAERVLIAMSGGVDSSVAAARLCDAGFDVVGVTFHLWDYSDSGCERGRCCAPEDQHDARRVADALHVPHYTFDRRDLFRRTVVEPFVGAYLDGTTPSPCVACNRSVKLRQLIGLADRLGAAKIATGHYARVVHEDGRSRLHRGRDRAKDQSYFLHMLRADELERLVLPLGDATKAEVRREALARRLPGATKGESQELCFVPRGEYPAFIADWANGKTRPGHVVDDSGRIVGTHGGVHRFTVGQRKGLGVAQGRPLFVVEIDARSATVRLGGEDELYAQGARLADPSFGDDVSLPVEACVQVRARHEGQRALIAVERADAGDALVARFAAPVRAIAPGQIAVAYSGDRVLGGATIVGVLT